MFNGFPRPTPDGMKGVQIKSIQTGSSEITYPGTTLDVTIDKVNRDRTFVIATFRGASADGRNSTIGYLTSDTNLRVERLSDGSVASSFIEWTVVELSGNVSVQSGQTSWSSGTTADATITSVDTDKTFVVISWSIDQSSTDGRAPTAHLTSDTNLRFIRQYSSTGVTTKVAWFVVEFV